MGPLRFLIPILLAQDAAPTTPEPAPPAGLSPAAQAAYLVLGVTLLLFLLLFVIIAINVFRRIARRRERLERLHGPRARSANAESAWAVAGRRVKPLPEPRDPDENRPLRRGGLPADDDLDDDDTSWQDETDLDFGNDDDGPIPPPAPA